MGKSLDTPQMDPSSRQLLWFVYVLFQFVIKFILKTSAYLLMDSLHPTPTVFLIYSDFHRFETILFYT